MKCPKCFKEMERFLANHYRCKEHVIFNLPCVEGFWSGWKAKENQNITPAQPDLASNQHEMDKGSKGRQAG